MWVWLYTRGLQIAVLGCAFAIILYCAKFAWQEFKNGTLFPEPEWDE